MSMRPWHSEIVADRVVHVVGIASGAVGAILLMVWAAWTLPPTSIAALTVYCVGLLAMLCCSGAYHLLAVPAWKPTLRRLDHAAIFLMIAGTYTPFSVVKLDGAASVVLLVGVWLVAAAGVAAKLLLTARWDRLAIGIYLALGWSGVVMLRPLVARVSPESLALLAVGGIIYSLGVIFFVWERLPYQTAIWHAFVLAGAACHFGAVALAMAA
ncbi:MAG: hemolysin III family protein [Hyphomicrobiaceae bacterium]